MGKWPLATSCQTIWRTRIEPRLSALILCLLLAGCGAGPSDQLSINPSCGQTYKAVSGQPIEVHFGAWGALGRELVEDNARHLTVQFELDGETIPGVQEPAVACEAITGYLCGVSQGYCSDGSYWIIHKATLGPLAPGEHEVIITHTFDEQITDGYDSDEDGQPDTFGPGIWTRRQYTIVVKA